MTTSPKKPSKLSNSQSKPMSISSVYRTSATVKTYGAVRKWLADAGCNPALVAKIEIKQAVDNLAEILDETDAIMVARGDLGVEMPLHLVPTTQKRMIRLANEVGKPVITATQNA